jgi:kynureninase
MEGAFEQEVRAGKGWTIKKSNIETAPMFSPSFEPGQEYARLQDDADPLRSYRDQFLLPRRPDGSPMVYLCGHSLGLQPVAARALVEQELDDWARLGVDGHFRGQTPWYSYHETLRDAGARLVGALPHEVVFMNSLTVNLHLLMATFYRPAGARRCILIDEPAFPSDLYAAQSQIRWHGLNPADCLLAVGPREGEHTVRIEDVEGTLERRGSEIAVVWWNGVNFLTGQYFDAPRLVSAAQRRGCLVGLDLAHAAANVPLSLHDAGVDFAVWCSYKYLNGGPGAVGGAFVHEKHGRGAVLPRLAGWWGNDPATRFRMQLQPDFIPKEGADGWQVSNPPILAMAPLRASLRLFDEAGAAALRTKSERLTAYLLFLLDRLPAGRCEVVTPRDPQRRGSMISLVIHDRPRETAAALEAAGVVCDFREPNVVRAAPAPLYNSYEDVWRFAEALGRQ